MKQKIIFLLILFFFSCKNNGWEIIDNKKELNKNFDTPQGAVLCLEDAYKSKDIEKIIKCKDFKLEVIYMLKYKMKKMDENFIKDKNIIKNLAETLELSFLNEMNNAIPNFDDIVKSEFSRIKKIDDQFVLLEEVCTFSDGFKSKQTLIVGKGDAGWKMIAPK
jgi:hypothetical protein